MIDPKWSILTGATALSGAILGGGLIGWAVDAWRGTDPFGVMVGVLIGTGVGIYELWLVLRRSRNRR